MKKGIIVTATILSLFIVTIKSTAEMKIVPGGVTFPDNTTQTTSATGGSGRWSANDFKIYYNSGNVGIGTTNPGEKLEVTGNIAVSGAGNGVKFPDGTVQTTAAAPTWHQILPAAERFKLVMNSNAAVLDKETGLVWDKSPNTSQRTWFNAIIHCYQREVGGRKGWRLPTIEELASLVDSSQSNPALPAGNPFSNVQFYYFWTSTTLAGQSTYKWYVYFSNGGVGISDRNTNSYVWCVRGGYGHDAY